MRRYVQEAALVPIVEPEVLMAGRHGIASCLAATATVLRAVFHDLDRQPWRRRYRERYGVRL